MEKKSRDFEGVFVRKEAASRAKVPIAFNLGKDAYCAGKKRNVLSDENFQALTSGRHLKTTIEEASRDHPLMEAWYRGWDAANIDAPVPGKCQKKKD